jgi:hypothetical protein
MLAAAAGFVVGGSAQLATRNASSAPRANFRKFDICKSRGVNTIEAWSRKK